MLRNHKWGLRYTSDDCDLSERFYVPALKDAVTYDRGTGYFSAESLVRNIDGLKGLVDNNGRMRLLVGCTLNKDEVEAIQRGEDWKKQVERNLLKISLNPDDLPSREGLELLSWMIASGHLTVKIAVIHDENGRPVADSSIYHKKIGIVRDAAGDRIAWAGSNNETPSGQSLNSELLMVSTSWGSSEYVESIASDFETDWTGRSNRVWVMDVPEAVRQKLLSHAPPKGKPPVLLTGRDDSNSAYDEVWEFIGRAHEAPDGAMLGLATAPVVPWPHQVQVLRRLQSAGQARLMISDEVGLGKTIQAGLFMRQAWLEGRKRILILAPANLVCQWQTELREKLNLDWPVYERPNLIWQKTHARPRRSKLACDIAEHGPVIMSSQLARRDEYMPRITSARWDVVVLDEAHHARRKNPNSQRFVPGNLLRLMQQLKDRTDDLILLTATPMQIHPVELYDLLGLLGMPPEWDWNNFERFTNCLNNHEFGDISFLRRMFAASEKRYGAIDAAKLGFGLKCKKVFRVLAGSDEKLQPGDHKMLEHALRLCSPTSRLMSRNTRRQLREYIRNNSLDWRLGKRVVDDDFDDMSWDERRVYRDVYAYTRHIWNSYKGASRRATGFLSSTYLVRLTSSFAALGRTLQSHLDYMQGKTSLDLSADDEWDDFDEDESGEVGDMLRLMRRDAGEVHRLLGMINNLPVDTKLGRLTRQIDTLLGKGYDQVMVFTQFTDTMDFLRDELGKKWSVLCYSGRGGEARNRDGDWLPLSKKETKRRFADGDCTILLCTQSAAEGLNFQFCGALVNYDMPWNPMKVEQRIGRIDRIGQKYEIMRIVNLYYTGTIEAKRYKILRERYNLFEETVGRLPSILSDDEIVERLPEGGESVAEDGLLRDKSQEPDLFDLDEILAADTSEYVPPRSPIDTDDLSRIIGDRRIMRQFNMVEKGLGLHEITIDDNQYRITADRGQFEKLADDLEFWAPGTPLFPKPKKPAGNLRHATLGQLLDSLAK